MSDQGPVTAERVCPHCGRAITPVPIIYGFPAHETFMAYERGEIALGGCIVTDDDPQFACPACEAKLAP